jgi:hypothetical protein
MNAAKKQQTKNIRLSGQSNSNDARVEKIKKLFAEWLQDSSGYDEQTWPELKEALNAKYSMPHTPFTV